LDSRKKKGPAARRTERGLHKSRFKGKRKEAPQRGGKEKDVVQGHVTAMTKTPKTNKNNRTRRKRSGTDRDVRKSCGQGD